MENKEETVAERIASRLIGQCTVSLDQALLDETGLELTAAPTSLLEKIDDLVFCCDDCGWYCSTDELNDEQLCDDCADEEDLD